jgi:hypothetical protein
MFKINIFKITCISGMKIISILLGYWIMKGSIERFKLHFFGTYETGILIILKIYCFYTYVQSTKMNSFALIPHQFW